MLHLQSNTEYLEGDHDFSIKVASEVKTNLIKPHVTVTFGSIHVSRLSV